MSAGTYDFQFDQGTDYNIPIRLSDAEGEALNLSGFKARMQIRRFSWSPELIDDLSSENGRIDIDQENGLMTLHFSNEKTSSFPIADLVYDLELTSSEGRVSRIMQGAVEISAEVTRERQDECDCGGIEGDQGGRNAS